MNEGKTLPTFVVRLIFFIKDTYLFCIISFLIIFYKKYFSTFSVNFLYWVLASFRFFSTTSRCSFSRCIYVYISIELCYLGLFNSPLQMDRVYAMKDKHR